MKTVKFTEMKKGSKEDYELLAEYEKNYVNELPDRILESLKNLDNSVDGYQVSRLEHSLQSATRAEKDGADEEMIVATLLHDIGDSLAPYNHSQLIAAVLRPYVSEKVHWIMLHHGLFQEYYYAHHLGRIEIHEINLKTTHTIKMRLIFVKSGIKNLLILIMNPSR